MHALLFLAYKKLKNGFLQLLKPRFIITILIYLAFIVPFLIIPAEGIEINISDELYLTGCWFLYGITSSALIVNIILSGVTKFERSDADYLINSPINPRYIFLYGFLQKYKKTIGLLFLILICLGLSLKNISQIAIGTYFKTIVGLIWLLLLIFVFILQVLKHITKHNKSKLLLWMFTASYSAITIIAPLMDLFSPIGFSNWREYIPFCGWAFKTLNNLMSPNIKSIALSYLLIVISCLICLFLLTIQDFSCFYDCFLEKSHSTKTAHSNNKYSKKVYGSGVVALIGKDRIETLRKDKLPFVDIGTLIISIFVLVLGVGLSQSYTENGEPLPPILILSVSLLLLALFSVLCFNVGTIKNELKNIYIHLIPETAFKKIIALTIMPCIRHFTVAFVLILVLSVISSASLTLIIYTSVLYLSTTLLLMSVNILFIRFFGSDIDEAFGLWVYLKLVLGFIVLLPAITSLIVIFILFDSIAFSFIAATFINMLIYLIICKSCKLLAA